MKKAANHSKQVVQGIYKGLDLVTAALLLTGQIAIGGVFVAPEGFALSLAGAITGREVSGNTRPAQLVLDGLDVITAVLIILDQLNVVGAYITTHRFTVVVGGPLLGGPKTEAHIPSASAFIASYSAEILTRFHIKVT